MAHTLLCERWWAKRKLLPRHATHSSRSTTVDLGWQFRTHTEHEGIGNEFLILNKDCERLRRFSIFFSLTLHISLSICIFIFHIQPDMCERKMIQNCEFDLYCARQLTIKLRFKAREIGLKCALIYSSRYDNKRAKFLSQLSLSRACITKSFESRLNAIAARVYNNKNIGCDLFVLRKCRHLRKYNDQREDTNSIIEFTFFPLALACCCAIWYVVNKTTKTLEREIEALKFDESK